MNVSYIYMYHLITSLDWTTPSPIQLLNSKTGQLGGFPRMLPGGGLRRGRPTWGDRERASLVRRNWWRATCSGCFLDWLPSGYVNIAMDNGHLLVDAFIKKMMIFHSDANLPESESWWKQMILDYVWKNGTIRAAGSSYCWYLAGVDNVPEDGFGLFSCNPRPHR